MATLCGSMVVDVNIDSITITGQSFSAGAALLKFPAHFLYDASAGKFVRCPLLKKLAGQMLCAGHARWKNRAASNDEWQTRREAARRDYAPMPSSRL